MDGWMDGWLTGGGWLDGGTDEWPDGRGTPSEFNRTEFNRTEFNKWTEFNQDQNLTDVKNKTQFSNLQLSDW